MKIDQEKFNQLSQLDRIEFRQISNRIWKRIQENLPNLDFLWYIIIITLLMLNLISSIYGNFGIEYIDLIMSLLKLTSLFFLISLALVLFSALWGIVFAIKGIKDEKKLCEEYFKVEVRKAVREELKTKNTKIRKKS